MQLKYTSVVALAVMLCGAAANAAIEYKTGPVGFKLSGYANGGLIEPDFDEPKWLGDWAVRGQMNYALTDGQTLGLVYAMDQAALDENHFAHEMFGLYENRAYGRIEVGMTHSVARKLSVGLPDVGGLRVNETPLFYKKIRPDGAVIADTAIISGHEGLRANIVSVPVNGAQYGLSVAGLADEYDYAFDMGLKIRQPHGKLKTAYSFGASFMDNPKNYRPESYAPRVNADWRAQGSMGMNLQYNSWIWGMSLRAIYDKNPVGVVSDGVSFGTGVSYDLLRYSLSLTYILSDTGIWDSDVKDYADHTVIGSFRYKYSENVDGWISLGLTSDTPFVSAGVGLSF
ncbi:MAG: hypothetical protein NC311_02440 [Muribaculaceae bacterium]|nr:hypothetical protein [Muribaculaceae bacterium]